MKCLLSLRFWMVLAVLLVTLSSAYAADRLVFEGDSAYTGMQVLDKSDGLRYLQFGIYEQTAMRLSDPDYLHYEYTRTIMAGFAFAHPPVKKVLMLGLGGGAMARFITGKFPEATLDIIEIDPLVVDVAKQYFGFKPGIHGNVFIGDGRQLLRKSKVKYDIIILDAYKAGEIPFHLTTREFMQSVRDHLTPSGVAVVHLWAEYANKYLHAQVKTIASVFPRNYSFYDNAGSFMIFATRLDHWLDKALVRQRGAKIGKERGFSFDLAKLIDDQYTEASRIPTKGLEGRILTDDFAPVNLLKHQQGQ
ncbi:MAG: fused MFS/spermidine synthase [Desulfuromonadales bacterium]|nr:fused MFS/spermidine synthase [Desulfuromonadales bacterium]